MARNGRRKGDEAFLTALAAGHTIKDAAGKAGISQRTATRRVTDDEFRQRVTELRAQMMGRALGKMADSMTDAADALRWLLKAKADTVKLGAARSILELGNKLRDAVEVEERLSALERRAEGRTNGQQPQGAFGANRNGLPSGR